MPNLIPIHQAGALAPQKMRDRIAAGQTLNSNFADGVRDAFPVLSIKGKVFRARAEGKEVIYKDPNTGHPYAFLDVILVNASRQLAKSYYIQGYSEGDMNPPDCWSLDSVRPDPSVVNKVNPTCQDCPMNAFGSRITPDGKAAKACSDARRIAVTLPHHLVEEDPASLLLRVPQSSLKNLKSYVELLARNGYEPGGCVSRLSFDMAAAFPKLQFEFVGPLTDEEFDTVIDLAGSQKIDAMLRAPDFENAPSPENIVNPSVASPRQRQAPPVTDDTPVAGGLGTVPQQRQRPVQQAAPVEEEVQQEEEDVTLIELPDGEGFLNPLTGEITKPVQAKAAEIDPDVIKLADGRFFHKTKKTFVASQFKDAVAAPAVPPAEQPEAKPAKRTRTVKPKAEAQPAEQPKPAQQAQPEAKAQPEAQSKPTVVAASPKLEALLSGLANKAPSGNA
jgi:hypothetical protein